MKLIFINFEMLPVVDGKELGTEGYVELFKKLVTQSFPEVTGYLGRNKYITFDSSSLRFLNNYLISGKIIIYKKPKPYKDLHTDEITREPKENEVENSVRLKFFFDAKKHIFAMQKHSAEMKNPYMIEKRLKILCGERIEKLREYDGYRLELITLTKKEELDKVINETQVVSIKIELTFPNGEDLENALLEDLRKDRGKLEYTEKAFDGSFMAGISRLAKHISSLAPRYGNVVMRYIEQNTNKLKTFILRNKPIEKTINGNEPEQQNLLTEEIIEEYINEALSESDAFGEDNEKL